MKRRANSILEIPYEISNGPETIEDCQAICGGDIALVVEHFTQKLVYNHHNAELRSAFLERVEEKTGIARKTDKKKKGDKEVEVYTETEGEYFDRVLAERGEKATDYTPLLQETADGYKDAEGKDVPGFPLDGTKKMRAGGGPKLAKMYLQGAEDIAKAGKLESAAAKLTAELGIPIEATVDSIAKGLKEREDRRRSEFVKGLL